MDRLLPPPPCCAVVAGVTGLYLGSGTLPTAHIPRPQHMVMGTEVHPPRSTSAGSNVLTRSAAAQPGAQQVCYFNFAILRASSLPGTEFFPLARCATAQLFHQRMHVGTGIHAAPPLWKV
jgi:hypothetical protein